MVDTQPSPIATLFPGYFALVMATGIVAIAAEQQGLDLLADALYVITVISYVVLAVLLAISIVRFWSYFAADVTNHAKGFAFSTTVAATNVLAAASIVIHGWWDFASALWWCSLVLWAVFIYTTLIAVVIDREKPGLEGGINGSWFLLTVSTQSIAVVAGLFLTRTDSDALAFTAIAAFTLGIVLYLIVMTMVFLRWTFQPLDPTEADPPAWIAAGAVAITVLAGSNILLAADQAPARIARMEPFLEGLVDTRLGHRHLLVPAHDRHRNLAAPHPPRAAAISPQLLGDGVPPRHVRRRHLPHAHSDRSRRTRLAPQARTRRRPRRLDRHLRRTPPPPRHGGIREGSKSVR